MAGNPTMDYILAYDPENEKYMVLSRAKTYRDHEDPLPWNVEVSGLPFRIAQAAMKGLTDE